MMSLMRPALRQPVPANAALLRYILILCLLASLTAASHAGESGQPPPDKPEISPSVFRWYYNPQDEPSWFSPGEGLKLVKEAFQAWRPCDVQFEFAGITHQRSGVLDGQNVIGWDGKLGPGKRAITRKMLNRKFKTLEQDVAFNSSRDEFRRYPRLLRKVMMHEIGHVLGLKHSPDCGDVMSLGADCRGVTPAMLPLEPTAHDMNICRSLAVDRFSIKQLKEMKNDAPRE